MKGELGTGKHLDETTIHKPDAVVTSGGKIPVTTTQTGTTTGGPTVGGGSLFGTGIGTGNSATGTPDTTTTGGGGTGVVNLFGGTGATPVRTQHSAPPTSGLNLLGQVETWGIGPAASVSNIALKIPKMTGAQLQKLLKELPDGVTYGLDLEKEAT
jgi:hypothetical protein